MVGFKVPTDEKAAVKLLAEHRQTTISDLVRNRAWKDLVREARELIERLDKARASA